MKTFNYFLLNEKIGHREQAEVDRLLDIMGRRKLSSSERDLLNKLIKGEPLPKEKKPTIQKHKTGGFMYDDEGNVITTNNDEDEPGKEFVTAKGKQRKQSEIEKIKDDEILDARVYKNNGKDDRFFFVYIANIDQENNIISDWIIYRSGGGDRFPFGQFMSKESENYKAFKNKSPDQLWNELDREFDFFMVLDKELYDNFLNFYDLYHENASKNKDILIKLKNKFISLL